MANERKLIYADSGEIAAEYMKKHIVPSDSDFLRGYLAGVDAVAKGLAGLPPVDAMEVVHGRWVALDDDCEEVEGETEALRWGCTACHETVEYDDWTHRTRLTKFCPNCGAKMGGGNNA